MNRPRPQDGQMPAKSRRAAWATGAGAGPDEEEHGLPGLALGRLGPEEAGPLAGGQVSLGRPEDEGGWPGSGSRRPGGAPGRPSAAASRSAAMSCQADSRASTGSSRSSRCGASSRRPGAPRGPGRRPGPRSPGRRPRRRRWPGPSRRGRARTGRPPARRARRRRRPPLVQDACKAARGIGAPTSSAGAVGRQGDQQLPAVVEHAAGDEHVGPRRGRDPGHRAVEPVAPAGGRLEAARAACPRRREVVSCEVPIVGKARPSAMARSQSAARSWPRSAAATSRRVAALNCERMKAAVRLPSATRRLAADQRRPIEAAPPKPAGTGHRGTPASTRACQRSSGQSPASSAGPVEPGQPGDIGRIVKEGQEIGAVGRGDRVTSGHRVTCGRIRDEAVVGWSWNDPLSDILGKGTGWLEQPLTRYLLSVFCFLSSVSPQLLGWTVHYDGGAAAAGCPQSPQFEGPMPPPYCYEYPRPSVTVDLVVFCCEADQLRILLIRHGATTHLRAAGRCRGGSSTWTRPPMSGHAAN